MSFVKKAVKKVFKVVKRAVKKVGSFLKRAWDNPYVRMAIIIAAAYFTAGLINPSFSWSQAWSANMAAAGGANATMAAKVGVFFQTVGQTISAGSAYISQGVSNLFGQGSAPAAGTVGNTTTSAATVGSDAWALEEVAVTATKIGNAAVPTTDALIASGANKASGALAAENIAATTELMAGSATSGLGTWGQIAKTGIDLSKKFGKLLLSDSWQGSAARWGISLGLQSYWQNKQFEKEEWYFRGRNIYGMPAFGGEEGEGWAGKLLQPRINRGATAQSVDQLAQQQGPQTQAGEMAQTPTGPVPASANYAQASPGLLAPQPQQAGYSPEIQGLLAQSGVPAHQTQAPPATQPSQGRPPYGVYPELLGVA